MKCSDLPIPGGSDVPYQRVALTKTGGGQLAPIRAKGQPIAGWAGKNHLVPGFGVVQARIPSDANQGQPAPVGAPGVARRGALIPRVAALSAVIGLRELYESDEARTLGPDPGVAASCSSSTA